MINWELNFNNNYSIFGSYSIMGGVGDKMKKKKVLELVKCKEKFTIQYCEIDKYKKPGVWVMYDEKEQLLEVAQTRNVYNELIRNMALIMKDYPEDIDRKKRYTAQTLFPFNKKFDVLMCDKNRTEAKYRNISEESKRIVVYVILEKDATDNNKTNRENIEMKIAVNNHALYWNAFGNQRILAREFYNKSKSSPK